MQNRALSFFRRNVDFGCAFFTQYFIPFYHFLGQCGGMYKLNLATTKDDRVVFSSVAGAAEYQGDLLGEFEKRGNYNGRISYVQRDDVG